VTWPSGRTDTVSEIAAGAVVTLDEVAIFAHGFE
jgi:hypothetical protein